MDPATKAACRPPPFVAAPFWDVAGLAYARKLIVAYRAQGLPDLFAQTFQELCDAQGRDCVTAYLKILGMTLLETEDPENIKAILATQFRDFELGAERKKALEPMLGRGIFTADGPQWEHFRAMVRPAFNRDQIGDLGPQERHCDTLLESLEVDSTTGWTEVLELQPYFHRHTLDTSCEVLFGESVESQRAAMSHDDADATGNLGVQFSNAFDQLIRFAETAGKDNWWKPWQSPDYSSARKTCHDFVDHYVELAQSAVSGEASEQKGAAIGDQTHQKGRKYILSHELARSSDDPVEIRSQLLHILLAGRDTTAILLSWLFLMLSRNPSIFQKLRTTILKDFGTQKSQEQHKISFASLKSCSYLQHCLLETLRLFPPVPGNGRMAVRDTTLPRGGGPKGEDPVFVAKGTIVEYHAFLVHRRKATWGEDAADFRPERWEGRKIGWDFLAFNGGPRMCPGQQFALTTAGYAVVRLLQHFDTLESADTDPIRYNVHLTMSSGNGVRVRLHKAQVEH